jgi:hypothetical protein
MMVPMKVPDDRADDDDDDRDGAESSPSNRSLKISAQIAMNDGGGA